MLAAVGIFVMGGCFSFYQGVHTLLASGSGHKRFDIVFGGLTVSFCPDGASLARAALQVSGPGAGTGAA